MDQLKADIRSILTPFPLGLSSLEVEEFYEKMIGQRLNCFRYNYDSVSDLLHDIPDVCEIKYGRFFPVPTTETAHIQRMVECQDRSQDICQLKKRNGFRTVQALLRADFHKKRDFRQSPAAHSDEKIWTNTHDKTLTVEYSEGNDSGSDSSSHQPPTLDSDSMNSEISGLERRHESLNSDLRPSTSNHSSSPIPPIQEQRTRKCSRSIFGSRNVTPTPTNNHGNQNYLKSLAKLQCTSPISPFFEAHVNIDQKVDNAAAVAITEKPIEENARACNQPIFHPTKASCRILENMLIVMKKYPPGQLLTTNLLIGNYEYVHKSKLDLSTTTYDTIERLIDELGQSYKLYVDRNHKHPSVFYLPCSQFLSPKVKKKAFIARLLTFNSLDDFYVLNIDSEEEYETMFKLMNEQYRHNISVSRSMDWNAGDICICLLINSVRRAVVLAKNCTSYDVFLVDTGEVIKSVAFLLPITKHFARLPMQAIACSLVTTDQTNLDDFSLISQMNKYGTRRLICTPQEEITSPMDKVPVRVELVQSIDNILERKLTRVKRYAAFRHG